MWTDFLISGILFSFLLTGFAVKKFPQWGFLDFPERYGLTREKLPYPGGLIIFLLSLLLTFIHPQYLPLIPAIIILGLLSFWDDKKNISAISRLIIHISLAIYVFFMGVKIAFIGHPFQNTNIEILENFPAIAFFITIFWILSIQNAMNWFDGIPGLTVGVSGVGFLTLAVLGIIRPELFLDPNHTPLTMANFYLGGICVGAFWYFWRNKIILGDTGSQVLGFLLAVMSIFSGAKIATTLLVLSLPILDFFWVIFRRLILEKRSPLKGDMKHIHHRISKKIEPQITTLLLVLFSALFGSASVFLTGIYQIAALILLGGIFFFGNLYLWKKNK